MARRGGGVAAHQLADIMTGQYYQQAVERGQKAVTGQKLKDRRKKMVKAATAKIETAQKEWEKVVGDWEKKQKGLKKGGGKHWGWLGKALAVASIAAMFVPGAQPLSVGLRAASPWLAGGSLAAQGISTGMRSKELDKLFKKHQGEFLTSEDTKQFKGSFLEDYMKGAVKNIGDVWKTAGEQAKSAMWGNFATNAMMTLQGMAASAGGGVGGGGGGIGGKGGFWGNLAGKMSNFNLNPNAPGAGMAGAFSPSPGMPISSAVDWSRYPGTGRPPMLSPNMRVAPPNFVGGGGTTGGIGVGQPNLIGGPNTGGMGVGQPNYITNVPQVPPMSPTNVSALASTSAPVGQSLLESLGGAGKIGYAGIYEDPTVSGKQLTGADMYNLRAGVPSYLTAFNQGFWM